MVVGGVGDAEEIRHVVRGLAGDRVLIEKVLGVPPVRLRVATGYGTAVFAFTTDIPFLSRWGKPLLLGPGSIHVAHTDREHLRIDDLHQAVDVYERLARTLLG